MSEKNFYFSLQLNQLITELKSYKDKKVALYGYGTVGKIALSELQKNVICIADKNIQNIDSINSNVNLIKPEQLEQYDFDYLIITVLGREPEIIDSLNILPKKVITLSFLEQENHRIKVSKEDRQKWQDLKDKFKGERCFIIGNGPSLNKHDLTLLNNEYTFGVNGIFYKTEECGFKPTFYVVEDNHVVDDNLDMINSYDCPYKFFPTRDKDKIIANSHTIFFNYEMGFFNQNSKYFCKPRFSFDCSEQVFAGQTVTYTNIQLAYYLGFTEVYLIGVDFNYQVPKSTTIEGDTYISNEDDPNHFHPEYFGKGKKWHDPKLDRVALNYEQAKKVFDLNNRKIYNASIEGKLEIFERVDWFSIKGIHE